MKTTRWLPTAVVALVFVWDSALGTSLTLVRTFPTPRDGQNGMTFVGDDLWLWDAAGPDTLYVLDPHNGQVQATYSAPETGGGAGLGYDGQYLWGSAGGTSLRHFVKMDTQDGSVIESFPLPVPEPTGIAFDGTSLWVSQIDGYSLAAVDPATGAVIRTIQKEPLFSFDLAWDGEALWLSAFERGEPYKFFIYQINPQSGATLAVYDGPAGGAGGMAIKDDQLFVSSAYPDNKVYVYDLPASAPEPASLLITIMGCMFVGGRKRMCRRFGA